MRLIQRLPGWQLIGALLCAAVVYGCGDETPARSADPLGSIRDARIRTDPTSQDMYPFLPMDASVRDRRDQGALSGDTGTSRDAGNTPLFDGTVGDGSVANLCQPGATRCDGLSRVERCDDHDGNGSVEWQAVGQCAANEMCRNGECIPVDGPACEDRCGPGTTRCAGGQVQRCGEGPDGCLNWMQPEPCPNGGGCRGGQCVDAPRCQDQCAQGQTICDREQVRNCVLGADGCFEWSAPEACPGDLSCRLGRCRCEGECLVGSRECVEQGVRTCAEVDGCGQWAPAAPCPGDQVCNNGFCQRAPCEDECVAPGQRECVGDLQRVCEIDANLCRRWGDPMPCPDGRVCRPEGCVFECADECPFVGADRCDGDTQIQRCRRDPRTQCRRWEDFAQCQPGSVCRDGQCFIAQ